MTRPTLTRTRLTWLTYAQLGVFGFFLYGFGPSVPLQRDDLHLSSAVGGLHGTALATGSTLAGFLYARVSARIGRAATLRIGLLGLAAGIVVYCLVPVLPATLAGAFVCGFFGSLVVTGSVVVLSTVHGAAGPAAVTEANAGAVGIGLVTPLLLGAGESVGITWRPALLLPAVAAVAVWFVSVREKQRLEAGPAPAPPRPDAPGALPTPYWLVWVVVLCCIAVEFCLTFWAADGLRDRTGASPAAATAGVTAVVGGMFLGRLGGGRIALRLPPATLLLGSIAVSLAGFAAFWISTTPVPALAGLVVVGMGIAVQYPLGIALAVAASGGRPDRAAGGLGIAAGLASGVAPFVLGALADRVGTHSAFLLVPILLAAATAGLLVSRAQA
ncbi:MAG TPA: MFS transporter [Mycobacteriales bacterium]|nr:MFS transporter [Mycobacteriales bacterium]